MYFHSRLLLDFRTVLLKLNCLAFSIIESLISLEEVMKNFGFRCGYMVGNRSRFSKYYMTGSPVFSPINRFTNQAILKCFIDLKSSVWFTLVSDFRSIKYFRIA